MATLRHRTRRTAQNTQYIYELNKRIYDVKTYPVQSPQGATILIYAHENGVTIVWRGGRRLKPLTLAPPKKEKPNGGKPADDAVMIIDSDDDDAPAAVPAFVDKPQFEAEDPEANNTEPEIVQTLDLAFGTDVLHIAIPNGPVNDKLTFVVGCLTSDVYVVALPMTPPSHESKARPELRNNLMAAAAGNGTWGETLIPLGGQSRQSDGLAMALVRPKPADPNKKRGPAPATRIVVAAHSREASGTLRLWDVAIGGKKPDHPVEPFQTEYLPSPLSNISFNPAHTTQLLAISAPHAARIYDYALPSVPQEELAEGAFPTQGSWLLSLYAPFARGAPAPTARKPIVAASWISRGRAILALLADGQWGIWDVEGSGPAPVNSPSSTTALFKQGSGIHGAALTTFNVTGQLEGTSPLRNPVGRKSEGEFVPMTPHTRRDAATSLTGSAIERLSSVRGGITVTSVSGDEVATLWLGGADCIVGVIPGVARFWEAQLRRGPGGGVNLFSGAQPSRMVRLQDLNTGLLGERCCGVAVLPRKGGREASEEGLPVEVVVQGESRLVIVREAEAPSTPVGFLGSRKRNILGVEKPATAIIVHPRPDAPPLGDLMKFDLSVAKRGTLRSPKKKEASQDLLTGSLFNPNPSPAKAKRAFGGRDDMTFTQSMIFGGELSHAADGSGDEETVNERDIEEEMLDIMEIDRELEALEDDRGSGAKRVFFE